MAPELPPVLVAMALPAEAAGRFEAAGIAVLYTGVGKVNAAIAMTRRLACYAHAGEKPPLVLNFGTAGSLRHAPRTLVACRRFVDRDMDATALGFAHGTTPFDELPPMIEVPVQVPGLPDAICGTGDSFSTHAGVHAVDVVDMEAYAIAKACRVAGAEFACAKFVSDGADEHAARHWKENVAGAAELFLGLYREIISPAAGAASRA